MAISKIDKQLLKKRFSQNAKTYDQYANVQKIMAQKLLENAIGFFQTTIEDRHRLRILEIGCGTGFLTWKLKQSFPNAAITAIDLAPGMIEVAKKRFAGHPITFLVGDIEEMEITGTYDLIISNATFQWLNHLPSTIQRLVQVLEEKSLLLFSTFGHRTFEELHNSFQLAQQRQGLANQQKPGQSFFRLDDLEKLVRESFAPHHPQIECFDCIEIEKFRSVRDFFTSIKKIGASNSNVGDYCQRPGLMKEMMAIYDEQHRDGESVVATYHTIFMKIIK